MAFNGAGVGFGSCSRVVFGVAIVLFLFNVSTSAPTVSAASSEELQFARAEGNAQFLPSGVCPVSFLFLFKHVHCSIGHGTVTMCSRWWWVMVKIAGCAVSKCDYMVLLVLGGVLNMGDSNHCAGTQDGKSVMLRAEACCRARSPLRMAPSSWRLKGLTGEIFCTGLSITPEGGTSKTKATGR